jgi:DNA repair exonuclease SbcCD ATPase subunit
VKFDLIRITIRNFASIVNKLTFEVADMGPGLHFVRGRNDVNKRLGANGVGKSTLFAAACWALYGRTPDGLRNTDIEPWTADKKNSFVRVTFSLDGNEHKIIRKTHPSILTFDGKDVSQEFIDKRLCMNFTTFTNSVLAGQDRQLFLDRTPSEKLTQFSEVLDLDRWKERSKHASETATRLSNEIEVLEKLISTHETELTALSASIIDLKRRSENFDAEITEKVNQCRKELKKEQRRVDELKPRCEQAQLDLEQSMEYKSIQEQLEAARSDLRVVERNKVEFEVKIGNAIRERNDKTLALQELRASKTCPTCKQKIHREDTLGRRKEIKRQIAQLSKIISAGVPPRTLEAIDEFQAKIDKLTKEFMRRQKVVDAAQSVVSNIAPDLAQAKQRVYALTEDIKEIETRENPYFDQYNKARRERKHKQDLYDAQMKDLILKRRQHTRTKFWIKGFKDIRLMIVHETLQELELATNAILEEFGLIGWEIRYDVEKETKAGTIKRGMNVSILSPYNDKPVKWESWSGGEKQRLRLLGTFALSDVLLNRAGIEPSFEIFDEQSKFLSPEGVSDLVDVLADRAARTNKSIFLIDHTTIESARFASTTTIIRSKNGTDTITS